MNKITKETWEERMGEQFKGDSVFNTICKIRPSEHAPTRSLKAKIRRLLSYFTRYQIVDTWTVHDRCGDY